MENFLPTTHSFFIVLEIFFSILRSMSNRIRVYFEITVTETSKETPFILDSTLETENLGEVQIFMRGKRDGAN